MNSEMNYFVGIVYFVVPDDSFSSFTFAQLERHLI